MLKREKEVLQTFLDDEDAAIKNLEKSYARALRDIETRIKILQADEMTQSKIYQVQYQQALKAQIEGIIEKLHSDNYTSVQRYLDACYKKGFVGTMYSLHGQGMPILAPIDQRAAFRAVMLDSRLSTNLYTAIGIDTSKLKQDIRREISVGISSGASYDEIARNLRFATNAPLSRTKTIVRTEGHRVQQASAAEARNEAKRQGCDVLKQWDSTLDANTRPTHRALDGQIRETDEPFEVDGKKADRPGEFGRPEEDCNCRCVALTRARWGLDEAELQTMKDRAKFFGLDKTENFKEFEEKYLNAADSLKKQGESGIIGAAQPHQYKQFNAGEAANDFFYYDDESRGLLARRNSQHAKWQFSLTQNEKDCISDYTGGGYYDLNNYLRKIGDWQKRDAEKEEFIARNLDSAISRYKLMDNIRVQRGVMEDALDNLLAQYSDDISMLIGKIYRDSGYMSTTVLQGNSVATAKPVIFEIEIPAGAGRGAYVNQLAGQYQDAEYEFLLARNSKFEITGIEKNEEPIPPQTIIKMRLIADE